VNIHSKESSLTKSRRQRNLRDKRIRQKTEKLIDAFAQLAEAAQDYQEAMARHRERKEAIRLSGIQPPNTLTDKQLQTLIQKGKIVP